MSIVFFGGRRRGFKGAGACPPPFSPPPPLQFFAKNGTPRRTPRNPQQPTSAAEHGRRTRGAGSEKTADGAKAGNHKRGDKAQTRTTHGRDANQDNEPAAGNEKPPRTQADEPSKGARRQKARKARKHHRNEATPARDEKRQRTARRERPKRATSTTANTAHTPKKQKRTRARNGAPDTPRGWHKRNAPCPLGAA